MIRIMIKKIRSIVMTMLITWVTIMMMMMMMMLKHHLI